MSNEERLLTFEWDSANERLEIHGNRRGLEYLRRLLDDLCENLQHKDVHLMTASWGGNELSDEAQNMNSELVHHVKIMCWKDS